MQIILRRRSALMPQTSYILNLKWKSFKLIFFSHQSKERKKEKQLSNLSKTQTCLLFVFHLFLKKKKKKKRKTFPWSSYYMYFANFVIAHWTLTLSIAIKWLQDIKCNIWLLNTTKLKVVLVVCDVQTIATVYQISIRQITAKKWWKI